MVETLAALVQRKMEKEHLSLRTAGKQADVAHTTIDRVRNGETVDLETVKKISAWLGVPVSSMVDVGQEKKAMLEEVASLFALNDEFSDVFTKISKRIKDGKLSTDILIEITAFTSFRMQERDKKDSRKS
ncbi:MAG: hypothetical protein H0S79_10070 [Anaerolineaceae bacterium]|nr:hypothetical protein [Anaerolineaceae bacterium]